MMRSEDVRSTVPSSGRYVSIMKLLENEQYSERVDNLLRTNVIAAVHPGLTYSPGYRFFTRLLHIDNIENLRIYSAYLQRLKSFLHDADRDGSTILLYVPMNGIKQAFRAVGKLNNPIIVPTQPPTSMQGPDYKSDLSADIDESVIGGVEDEFYTFMGSHMRRVTLCGECESACVDVVATKFREYSVEVNIEKDKTFEPKE